VDNRQPVLVTRSQLLKLLLAGGIATAAASFLPGKWLKPVVKVGVLPVHAQSSFGEPLVISDFQIEYNEPDFTATFHFYDNLGVVDADSDITLRVEFAPLDTFNYYNPAKIGETHKIGASLYGTVNYSNATEGDVTFYFNSNTINVFRANTTRATFQVKLEEGGRTSNALDLYQDWG
jgi:hypothetical protein